jgi:creatinine amidohydrolase
VNWYSCVDPKGHFEDLGDHAGELETSVMLHVAPQHVAPLETAGSGHERKPRMRGLREKVAWAPRRWTQVTADTGIGDPSRATAEKGARFFDAVAGRIADYLVELAAADTGDLYE